APHRSPPPQRSSRSNELRDQVHRSRTLREQADRLGHLAIIGGPPLEFGLATEHVTCHLVTEVIVDQAPAAFLGLVAQVDVLLGEPTEHQLTHLVADLEFLARDHPALLDLDGSTNQGIAVQGDVGTDLAHEDPLAGGDRVAAHDTIGNDATTAAHDAAADGAVRRQRVDLERIAPFADRLGLTDLLLFALQLALNAATTRRVPARGGEL